MTIDPEIGGDHHLGEELEVAIGGHVPARAAFLEDRRKRALQMTGWPSTCRHAHQLEQHLAQNSREPDSAPSAALSKKWRSRAAVEPGEAARSLEPLGGVLRRAQRELLDQVLLGREVVVEGLLGDVGGLGDLERRGHREALPREQSHRGSDDPLVHLAAAPLAPALRQIRGRRRHGEFSGTVASGRRARE